ncbi:MAG: hypothetical protein ACFFCO_02125 [Promethearchaeota archaeon]
MPEEETDELDEAYRRFSQHLKSKLAERDPARDAELRARLERVDSETPHRARLFAEGEDTLRRLKSDFQITLKPPDTLEEYLVYLLTLERSSLAKPTTIAAADLYSQLHDASYFSDVSFKDFRRALAQLEKEKVLSLHESRGTVMIRIHQEFLSDDAAELLDVAARKGGALSLEQAMVATGWPQARVRTALEELLKKQLVVQTRSFVHGTQFQTTDQT